MGEKRSPTKRAAPFKNRSSRPVRKLHKLNRKFANQLGVLIRSLHKLIRTFYMAALVRKHIMLVILNVTGPGPG